MVTVTLLSEHFRGNVIGSSAYSSVGGGVGVSTIAGVIRGVNMIAGVIRGVSTIAGVIRGVSMIAGVMVVMEVVGLGLVR